MGKSKVVCKKPKLDIVVKQKGRRVVFEKVTPIHYGGFDFTLSYDSFKVEMVKNDKV